MKYIIVLLLSASIANAIMTIVPVELGNKPGFSGKISASLETKRGNTEKDEYNAGVLLQYDNNKSYVIWSDFSGSYGEASGERNTNKSYAHLRYIHTLYEKIFDWELYVQSESNEFTKIENRVLSGGGLRYKFLHNDYGRLYVGIGTFYESIHYTTDTDPYEVNLRINSYFAYTKNFANKSSIGYVLYYQPNTEEFSDYILSHAIELNVNIYKELYLSFVFYHDVDEKPALGVEKVDITQKTSFIFSF